MQYLIYAKIRAYNLRINLARLFQSKAEKAKLVRSIKSHILQFAELSKN
jgi:hypothetical protein